MPAGDWARAVAEVSGLFSRWLEEPDLLSARLELTVAATRDPQLAERFAQWREDLVGMVRDVLADAGNEPGSADALVAALEGVLLASLLQPADRRGTFVATSVELLLAGFDPGQEQA